MKLKSILIVCRERPTDDFDIYYEVGIRGITKIEKTQRYGEMAMIDIYNIYREEILIATIERPDVITYFKE